MLKGKTPIIMAGVFAVLAGMVAFMALQSSYDRYAGEWALGTVVVASKDIAEGDKLSRDNLTTAKIPMRFFKRNAVKPAEMRKGRIWGQKVAIPIYKGDPLLWSHIASMTTESRLSDTVDDQGGRAVTIRVGGEAAVGNWVRPADHVDILGTFRDPQTGEQIALTLLQNVIVLATGEISGQTNVRLLKPSARRYNNVTVHVMPEAAEMLVLAQQFGQLYLTLRNREDTDIEKIEKKTTVKTLLTGKKYKIIPPKKQKIIRPPKPKLPEIWEGSRRKQ